MTEKPHFEKSGRVIDINDLAEIEYWGHDAGEFIWPEIEKILSQSDHDSANSESILPPTHP